MGLLQDHADRYMLAGGEFLQVYLRFFYEVRKYGNLRKRLQLGKGASTPFGEKSEKLVRSLAYEVKRQPSYEIPSESENAKRDLDRALDFHHQTLALTLLNLSIIAIDDGKYDGVLFTTAASPGSSDILKTG